jgi:hypothetical protein
MNRLFTFALLALSLGIVFGCASSRVPLTQELRTRHNLSVEELKSLQYYNSHTITLRRELITAGKQVTEGHKLVLKSGQHIEEVVIEAGTPGAAVDVGPDFITVSFEPDTALTFALRGAEVPERVWGPGGIHNPTADPFPGNPGHQERRREPEPVYGSGNFWLYVPGADRRVTFAGTWFDAVEESLDAHLLIDAEALEEQEESERVLSGVKL